MRILIACEYSGIVRDAFEARGHHAVSCDILPTEEPGLHYQGNVSNILEGWEPVHYSADCDPDGDGWCYPMDKDPNYCDCYGPTQDGIEYKETDEGLFARPYDNPNWDLMIAHPPCTYLTCSAEWAYDDVPMIKGKPRKIKPGTLVGIERREARKEAEDFFMLLVNAPIPRIVIENPVGVMSSRFRKPDQIIQPYEYGHDASKKTALWLKNLSKLRQTKFIEPRYVNGKPRWSNQTDSGQNKLPPSADRGHIRSKTYQGWAEAMADQWGRYIEAQYS